MIVEFLGISGAGKTYVATQYCRFLEKEGVSYVWPWRNIYAKGYIQRNIKKSFVVSMKILISPRWCFKLFKYLFRQGIRGKRDLPVLFFNGIYLGHAFKKYGKNKGVTLFDEGLAQYLWAVHFRNRKNISKDELSELCALFQLPRILYVVTASNEIILSRMITRNVRDEIRERGNVMNELENGQNIIEKVAKSLYGREETRVVYIENNDNNDTDSIHWYQFENIKI